MVGRVSGTRGHNRLRLSRFINLTVDPFIFNQVHFAVVKDDYHLIVVDQRGFGDSTHPDDVKTSGAMFDLAGDLTCVLENAGVEKAICLGYIYSL